MPTPIRLFLILLALANPVFAKNAQRLIPLANPAGVSITGPFDVSLHTGYKNPVIVLQGHPADLSKVQVYRKGNLIQLDMQDKPQYGNIQAVVRSQKLKNFNYSGSGRISGNNMHAGPIDLFIRNQGPTTLRGQLDINRLTVAGKGLILLDGIKSRHLSLNLKDNAKLQLTGFINLTSVEASGRGWLGLHWVKSHFLSVRAKDKAIIQLGGVVNFLDIELRNSAVFKGRFLRADRVFARTRNESTAELTALRSQHTVALDSSDIFFYSIPDYRADFMGDNGAVLDMRAWNQYATEEYTIYNK